ncbi:MAG: hypothetical protein IT456_26465 [Planctomycetes bacterium]|nr:hypothetical protein [Planctomycetota bacterium]MCC7066365.1 hypothetical protein [Planctomycetota bacterium]
MHTNREMTEQDVALLRQKLTPLLERLAAETGLSVTMGKITYTKHNAVFAVEAAVRGEGGVTMGREAEAFLANAIQFGLEPGDLGRDFEHFDKWYRIVGMKPRSTKTPVICQQIAPPSQRLTLFPAHLVRHYMEQHGMRTKTSPHARVRIEVAGEPPEGELPAVTS